MLKLTAENKPQITQITQMERLKKSVKSAKSAVKKTICSKKRNYGK